jgi:hypothetical protein
VDERKKSSPAETQHGKVIALAAIALVVRLAIGTLPSFSTDEAFSFYVSRLDFRQIILAMLSDRHPPLHYLLQHLVSGIIDSEILLRLPSIIAAVVSTVLIYRISSIITRDERTSFLAGLMAAIMFSFWYLDASARMFSLAQVAALAATLCLLRIVILQDRRNINYILYVIFMLISLYTLYFAAFVLTGHLAVIAGLRRRDMRAWTAFASIGALMVPLFVLLRLQLASGNIEIFDPIYLKLHLGMLYPYYLGIVQLFQAFFHVRPGETVPLAAYSVLTALLILWQLKVLGKLRREKSKGADFLALFIAGYLVPLLLAAIALGLFNLRERYFFLLHPYMAILLAAGAAHLKSRLCRYAVPGLVILVNLLVFFHCNFNPYLWNFNFKPLADEIRTKGDKGDIIMFYLRGNYLCLFNYYYARREMRLVEYEGSIRVAEPSGPLYKEGRGLPQYLIRSLSDMERDMGALKKCSTAWLIMNTSGEGDFNEHSGVRRLMAQNFRVESGLSMTEAFGVYGEDTFFLYRCRPAARAAP